MGSGSSASVAHVLATLGSGADTGNYVPALRTLRGICNDADDEGKMRLIAEGNALALLVGIIAEERTPPTDAAAEAVACCWYLSRARGARAPILEEPGLLAALVKLVRRDSLLDGHCRGGALCCLTNCASGPAYIDLLMNPFHGVLDAVALVLATATLSDGNRHHAMKYVATVVRPRPPPPPFPHSLSFDSSLMCL
jgi:hypothetical protein